VQRALGLVDKVDIEAQISDSTSWAIGTIKVEDGRYDVEAVNSSTAVVKVPLLGDLPLFVTVVGVVGVTIDPIAGEGYEISWLCVELGRERGLTCEIARKALEDWAP